MISIFVIVYPLCLIKSMTGFRYFAVAILIIVIITLIVCIGEAPLFYSAYKDDPRYVINWLPSSDMVTLGWFQGMGSLLVAFNCQVTLIYVRAEMRHKTPKRITKVLISLISILLVLYVTMCTSGYFSLG